MAVGAATARRWFSSCELGSRPFPVPGQQLVELANVVIVDAGEHLGKPSLRVDVIEPRGLDQSVHDGGTFAAAIRAGEQPRLAPKCNLAVILPISGKKL